MLHSKDSDDPVNAHLEEGVRIKPITVGRYMKPVQPTCKLTPMKELELDEEGTRISLTIVDTPGFGDQIDNEARSDSITLQYFQPEINVIEVFLRSWAILNDNTMISWRKNHVSSVIQDFETIECMLFSISLRQLAMGKSNIYMVKVVSLKL